MTNIIIHRYREPTIGDIWAEFAPRVGRTLRLKLRNNLGGGVEGHAHSLRDHVSANQWGSSGEETGAPTPSENQASPAQNFNNKQER